MENRIKLSKSSKNDVFDYTMPKYSIFSGETENLILMQSLFNKTFNTEIIDIPFAGNINIQLTHNTSTTDYIINIEVNGNSILNIKFDEFKSKLFAKIKSYDDVDYYCGFKTKSKNDPFKVVCYVAIPVTAILLIVTIGLLIYMSKLNS